MTEVAKTNQIATVSGNYTSGMKKTDVSDLVLFKEKIYDFPLLDKSVLPSSFDQIDANKDGVLDSKEICFERDKEVAGKKQRKQILKFGGAAAVIGGSIGVACAATPVGLIAAGITFAGGTAMGLCGHFMDNGDKAQQETETYRQNFLYTK